MAHFFSPNITGEEKKTGEFPRCSFVTLLSRREGEKRQEFLGGESIRIYTATRQNRMYREKKKLTPGGAFFFDTAVILLLTDVSLISEL